MKKPRVEQIYLHHPIWRYKTKCNARGSDAQWEGNTAECKPALQAPPERVSPNSTAKRPMHLNLNQNRKHRYNLLKHFILQGFAKKPYVFRCTEKQ